MTPFHTLQRHLRTLAGFAALGLVVSLIVTFVQPLRYGATARVLIIQRSSYGVDPFTAVKSAERVAQNLAEVVYTNDFFVKVLTQDPAINASGFSERPATRRREWQRMIRTAVAPGTGLLSITALHRDRTEATRIASAIGAVVTTRGREYVGGDIDIKLVDAPIPTTFPISPNIPVNVAAGLVLGAIVGAGYVLRKSVSL